MIGDYRSWWLGNLNEREMAASWMNRAGERKLVLNWPGAGLKAELRYRIGSNRGLRREIHKFLSWSLSYYLYY